MHEQQLSLHDYLNGISIYQKLYHGAMKPDESVNGNTKNQAQALKEHFGKKTDFDFKEKNLLKKLFRVVVRCGTIGMVMKTLRCTQWHRLTALIRRN